MRELVKRLRRDGEKIASELIILYNEKFYDLDVLYFNRLKEKVEREGLGPISAAFGGVREMAMELILPTFGYETELISKGGDMVLDFHTVEIKGTFKHHHQKGYGEHRNPKKQVDYRERLHLFTQEKVDIETVSIPLIRFEPMVIPSSYFDDESHKTNMRKLNRKKIRDEDIVGCWDIYYEDAIQQKFSLGLDK